MKQGLIMWAVINNVTQKVLVDEPDYPVLYPIRNEARNRVRMEKYYRDNTNARVRKVKVTIEEAE
jgi:hypothetical protein